MEVDEFPIVNDLVFTDLEAGILTLKDQQGVHRHYVRRRRNGPPSAEPPHFVQADNQFLPTVGPLAPENLPDVLTVLVRMHPTPNRDGSINATVEFPSTDEYHADEKAFLIWSLFRDVSKFESRRIVPEEIKTLLDQSEPKHRPWPIKEVQAEFSRWMKDKGW